MPMITTHTCVPSNLSLLNLILKPHSSPLEFFNSSVPLTRMPSSSLAIRNSYVVNPNGSQTLRFERARLASANSILFSIALAVVASTLPILVGKPGMFMLVEPGILRILAKFCNVGIVVCLKIHLIQDVLLLLTCLMMDKALENVLQQGVRFSSSALRICKENFIAMIPVFFKLLERWWNLTGSPPQPKNEKGKQRGNLGVYTGGTMDTPDSVKVFEYWHCCGSEDPFDPGCTAAPHTSYDD
ncbi:hypothetical protein RJ641_023184 [Dillenia turbinata]|uniref:Uncharacterized protein n=1 Tax=Dillenia turbinata TaxID=194707 RepID=A0AAN8UAX3_9MAGN